MLFSMASNRHTTEGFFGRHGSESCTFRRDDPDTPFAIKGNWLYVRKCKRKVSDLIVLDDRGTDYCFWVEVLAVGDNVGKMRPWSKLKCARLGVSKKTGNRFQRGQTLLMPWMPQAEELLNHSPFSKHEFFIDEEVPIITPEEAYA